MSTAIVQGATMEFIDEGAGPPLVLLHGFPLSSAMWGPQLGTLTKRYRVIAPDLPGHGHSEPISNPHLARWADQVVVLLEQLRVAKAVIAGLSMGGYVALAIARRHPNLLRGLILANTRAATDDDAGKERREATAQAVLSEGPEVLVKALLPKLLSPSAAPELKAEIEAMIRATSRQGAADASRAMARRDDSTRLVAKLAVPVLVITGEHDALIPLAESEQMARDAKQGTLVTLPGAGHLSNLEAPAAFDSAVRAFIDALPR